MPGVQQAKSVALPSRLPLVPAGDSRSTTVPQTKDARLLNCYAEYNQDEKTWEIYKRYGISTATVYSVSGNPAGRGVLSINLAGATGTGLYYVFGNNVYYNGSEVGTMSEGVNLGPVAMTSGAGAQTSFGTGVVVLYVSGGLGYYSTISGDAPVLSAISEPSWGSNQLCPGFQFLDTYLYVMDIYGNIWGSENPNSVVGWPALDVIVAGNDYSPGMALARQLAYLLAFKQNSVQVFYTAGGVATTAGSPLANIPESQIPLGCANGFTVASIDELVFYVTNNNESPQILAIENLSPRLVSPPWVDRILSKVSWQAYQYQGVYAYTIKHAGHRMYVLTLVLENITLVYDIDQKRWYYWTDQNGNYWPYAGASYLQAGIASSGTYVIQHASNGNTYYLDEAAVYPTDSGVLVPADIYTPNFDGGVDRIKQLQVLRFNADQQAGSQLLVRWSDDDYQTYSNFREVDLGLKRPYLKNCGSFRRRTHHIRHYRPTPFRLKSVDLTLDIGTN